MSDRSQKTEQPTPRRLHKAREEGNFPSAKHLVGAAQFMLFLALMGSGGAHWFLNLRQSTRDVLAKAFAADLSAQQLTQLCVSQAWKAFTPLMSLGAILVIATLAAQL